MKKLVFKFSLFILGVLLILVSYFSQPSAGINNAANNISMPDSQFQIGAFSYYVPNNYRFTQLGFNVWHKYTQLETGWTDYDKYDDTNDTRDIITARLDSNSNYNLRTYFDRPIVEYVIAGQRIDYECESINNQEDLFWFNKYGFVGTSEERLIYEVEDTSKYGKYEEIPYGSNDSTARVIYCKRDNNNPESNAGYVNKNLYANRNLSYDLAANGWSNASAYDWYVMPRIRIDSSYAANSINFDSVVCRIEVLGWDSVLVKAVQIKARNFLDDSSSQYDGDYVENYNFSTGQTDLILTKEQISDYFIPDTASKVLNWEIPCKVDIRIYWTGKCDMWIDRVRVENFPAHQYLTLEDDNNNFLKNKINIEAELSMRDYNLSSPIPNYFYFEECTINHFPAIRALNKQIMTATSNQNSLLVWLNNFQVNALIPNPDINKLNADKLYELINDYSGMPAMVMGWYGLEGWQYRQHPERISYHPSTLCTLNYSEQDFRLSYRESPSVYDDWLQYRFDEDFSATNNVINVDKLMDILSRKGMRVINCPQAHSFFMEGGPLKEPSNQEIEMQVGLAITYNAKGIMFYCFDSFNHNPGKNEWGYGIMDDGIDTPRTVTAYGQDKFQHISKISKKINNWEPYLMSFDPNSTKSCIYRLEDERDNFLTNTSFADIITYKTSSVTPECTEDNPGGTSPQGLTYDCINDRYLQAATFERSTGDINKYFMIVNRRCSPYIDESSEDNRGGKRFVRVRFDANSLEFANFNNWKIIELDSNRTVAVFDKRATALIDLGWYDPGQGKLYKIAPVMQEGGTFVCDEAVSPSIFTCNGTVLNNGYDIIISPNTAITFSNDAGIEMNGGSFECGEFSTEDNLVIFNGTDSSKGLVLKNCSNVGIYNTSVSNLKNDSSETAILISNTYDINMKGCIFNAAANSGGINISFTVELQDTLSLNISECSFLMGSSGCDALSISSNGSPSAAVLLDWCTFTTTNDSSNALRLINVTGGAVKNSTFVNFNTTISALGSAFDLYNNKILGKTYSTGIFCADVSNINLKPISGNYLGGYNYIKNYGTSSSCINVNNSYFDINAGENDFDLSDLDNSKFFTGTLYGDPCENVDAYKNCFHEDSTMNVDANHSVTWYNNSDPVGFTFTDYSCELTPLENFFVLQYEGYNDTIYRSGGGEGGGFNPNKTLNIEENIYKSLKDTVNINLRKRNYQTVETSSKLILTQYPDSLESIGMVQKLYMASLNLDSTKIGLTKTFLENLISNNTQNLSLIKRAFYFIQKCKVKLGQYQSALEGFQYIMTQNPYTYEGLVASWDYAATYLLMGTGGSIQGDNEQTLEDFNTPADTLINRMSKRDINSAKNKNSNTSTNEQTTKIFYEKIKNTTKDDRSKQEEKVKTLEKKLESSKSTPEKNEAARELAVMKQIKEAVKIKKPNTVMNHIQIMNDDIKKVFGVGKQSSKESTNSLIPQTYQLYQNYPNPFNPTTKIAFDLPKDAKVKLVIYDILGREMKTLVNNEFRSAGKYITEFNGSNMSSGIYFARILVNEGKDFIAVKKMVLLK